MNDYQWEEGMGQISGFGGGYEEACQTMLFAGLRWLDEHPGADPIFSEYAGITGIINENNDDAKALSHAIGNAVDDCTGAMHHAVVKHCMYIKTHGWDHYVQRMKQEKKDGG